MSEHAGLLADLIDEYGEDALLVVGPYVLGDGPDDYRWFVQVDRTDLPEMDVHVRDDPDFPGGQILSISRELGGEQLDVLRWTPKGGVPYAQAMRTLRNLRDAG